MVSLLSCQAFCCCAFQPRWEEILCVLTGCVHRWHRGLGRVSTSRSTLDLCLRMNSENMTKYDTPVFNITPDYLIFASRANDGCLYVYDLEQNKRTLKVSLSGRVFALTCTCFWVLSTSRASSCDQGEENFSRPESFWGQLHPTVGRACWTVLTPLPTTPSCVNQ